MISLRARFGFAALAATAGIVAGRGARAADPVPAGARGATADPATTYPECGKVSPANATAAHGAFLAGKSSFDAGDYATALTYLKDAYRRDCRKNDLLLIIARSYELLGSNGTTAAVAPGARRSAGKREAARALEVYLQRAPADADVATQRSHLSRLNEEIARLDAEDDALAARRAAAVKLATTPPAMGSANATPDSTATPAAGAPPAEPRGHTAAPWIIAGIGVAGVAAGAITYGVGSSKESDATSKCESHTACSPSVTSEGNDGAHAKTAGLVVLGVGGAALVGGLIWHFAESTGPRDSGSGASSGRFVLDPLLAPGLAGFGAHGTF